ncbi:MAG TPA: hypothetical protein VI759_07330 [Dehalococcoidia bacterium]|nr:hypothetical protein [Dehalococcoidia bacterium]
MSRPAGVIELQPRTPRWSSEELMLSWILSPAPWIAMFRDEDDYEAAARAYYRCRAAGERHGYGATNSKRRSQVVSAAVEHRQ